MLNQAKRLLPSARKAADDDALHQCGRLLPRIRVRLLLESGGLRALRSRMELTGVPEGN
ncbi:hypothetical protein [Nocardiopsis kunsanensis]|uniref:hypothetical protein n=1 Tax=Nocardiopsis kunsanensis TaxID=141693 RepID=UPI0003462CBE|nr:hypothetical protein [Nocardiopsis kunsanensis]